MQPVRQQVQAPSGVIDLFRIGDGPGHVLMLHACGSGAGSLLALAGLFAPLAVI